MTARIHHPLLFPNGFKRALIMGIVNVTPDSFSDGGLCEHVDQAVAHAMALIAEGADILDIGGESTRPGHAPVSQEEEQRRVLPVIKELARLTSIPISIDTYKADTAQKALQAGACIVNDIWGLQRDPDMAMVAAHVGASIIVMHNRQDIDETIDIIEDIIRFFDRSITIAINTGIARENIILDPGIGFGKTSDQSFKALPCIKSYKQFGLPILIGASRKSLIGRFFKQPTTPHDRIFGTIGAHLYAVSQGVHFVRVHDVKAHHDAFKVFESFNAVSY